MSGEQLVTAITAIAISISNTSTAEETAMLASIFVQLGDTLATLAVKKAENPD